MPWDADLYLKFASERTQPSIDLIARIGLANPARIIDLGCGPGNSTAMLRARWPHSELTGLDSSPEMIAAASVSYPDGRWELADAARWVADTPLDLVFSNATLQWIPNHSDLFPHLWKQVAPGGALAVQMPAHYGSLARQILFEVSSDPRWTEPMEAARRALTTEPLPFYYDVLRPLAARLELWETEYCHVLENHAAILTWYRATGLRPFLAALDSEAHRQQFEALLMDGYAHAFPTRPDGRVLLPFRRLFVLAYK